MDPLMVLMMEKLRVNFLEKHWDLLKVKVLALMKT